MQDRLIRGGASMNDINKTGRTFSWVIGWLFLSHVLADVAVAVYRWHDVDPALTDLLAAALSRSQLCLLAVWLVVGSERLSWRVCGLIVGICTSFASPVQPFQADQACLCELTSIRRNGLVLPALRPR